MLLVRPGPLSAGLLHTDAVSLPIIRSKSLTLSTQAAHTMRLLVDDHASLSCGTFPCQVTECSRRMGCTALGSKRITRAIRQPYDALRRFPSKTGAAHATLSINA